MAIQPTYRYTPIGTPRLVNPFESVGKFASDQLDRMQKQEILDERKRQFDQAPQRELDLYEQKLGVRAPYEQELAKIRATGKKAVAEEKTRQQKAKERAKTSRDILKQEQRYGDEISITTEPITITTLAVTDINPPLASGGGSIDGDEDQYKSG